MGLSPKGWWTIRLTPFHEPKLTRCKDHDLWYEDANCLVHFHAEGSSKRGPSLKIPFAAVQLSNCSYLLDQCLSVRRESTISQTSDSGYDSCGSPSPQPKIYDLFVPAPVDLSREQAYIYHVTTRNFFAFLLNQALVGEKLGLALIELWQRAQDWQPQDDAKARLLSYCDQQGYLSLAENVQYATAILNLAEKAHFRELWTNSFVHCVGMHDSLDLGPDHTELSNMTKALLTRASLEMDLHLSRVMRAVGSFLEEEFGIDRLGLSKPARAHLDRFRCFLSTHYMERLGYFPPSHSDPYDNQLWHDLHDDFDSLYELLADTKSDDDMNNASNASGGICCLQNTYAFNERHGCEPLPHPSPLLPAVSEAKRSTDTQRSLRSLRLVRSNSSSEVHLPPRMALAQATNSLPDRTANRKIVDAYRRFERSRPEEKITVQEARKVRWLLIYGVLQMLKSITNSPAGVEVGSASYPLCVLTVASPAWQDNQPDEVTKSTSSNSTLGKGEDFPSTPDEGPRPSTEGRISIHPDCEADNAADYFSTSRRSSVNAQDLTPPPLRIQHPTRTASIRMSMSSSVHSLQRSFSLARRNSSRKSMQAPRHRRQGSYEIVGQGFGSSTQRREASHREALEGLEGASQDSPAQKSVGTTHNPWQEFDFGLHNVAEEPILNDCHLDSMFSFEELGQREQTPTEPEYARDLDRVDEHNETAPGNRNSWLATDADFTTAISSSSRPAPDEPISATTCSTDPNSLRSSYLAEDCLTPATMYSSPAESPLSSPRHSFKSSSYFPRPKHISLLDSQSEPEPSARPSLNAGCYCPSGLERQTSVTPALSRFSSYRMGKDLRISEDEGHSVAGEDSQPRFSAVYELEATESNASVSDEVRGRVRARSDAAGFSFVH